MADESSRPFQPAGAAGRPDLARGLSSPRLAAALETRLRATLGSGAGAVLDAHGVDLGRLRVNLPHDASHADLADAIARAITRAATAKLEGRRP